VKTFAFCKVALSPVRAENRDVSEMVSQLLFGEPVEIVEVNLKWTKIVTLF
jgi:gamma-D-glutamyl-L-lysine dipeptidyl-peptidase